MSGKPRRRGGAFGNGNGTARGSQSAGASTGSGSSEAPPDLSRLSLGPSNIPTAVDGSWLQMAPPVTPPARRPVPGDLVDPKMFSKLLEDIRKYAKTAEFPLRKMFHTTRASVYTNHFALKLDPKLPLYQYEIKGMPTNMGKRKKKALVDALINKTGFLRSHQAEFVTDFRSLIISWVQFPEETLDPTPVHYRDDREDEEAIVLELAYNGVVDTQLPREYSEGKAEPTEVSHI